MAIKSKDIPGLNIAFCDQCFEVVEIVRYNPKLTLIEAYTAGEVRVVSSVQEHKCNALKPDRRHEWGRRAEIEQERQELGSFGHDED